MLVFLNFLWILCEAKYVLFWLYLWQLKDYHVPRFADHFRTHRGKQLIFDYAQTAKLILLLLFFSIPQFFSQLLAIMLLVYLGQGILFIKNIITKSAKKPVKTAKIVFLATACFIAIILFLGWVNGLDNYAQPSILLLFDILTPFIVSGIVLLLQLFFVFLRSRILRKAEIKMQKIRSVSKLKVIAVTGSYGKTSTKEFLATILSKKYKVLKTKDHQNSEIGVAKCILDELKPSHEIFIAEVGAYDKGKVKEVCKMLKPEIGIVTGVNEQHLSLFGSMKNLLSSEGGGELAEALPKNGFLIINGENKYCLELLKNSNNLPPERELIYATSNKIVSADIWAEGAVVNKNSVSFLATDKTKEMANFEVKVLGKQNVQNLLGAVLTAKKLGLALAESSQACRNIVQEQAGMTLKNGKHGILVVDSSYSANPDGVLADLDYLSVFSAKKVIVMPCLIELGGKSAEIHKKIGQKIGKICDSVIITSKDKFKEIKKGAMEAGMSERNILLCDNSKEIYSKITLFCKQGDVVLLEGRVPPQLIKLLTE